MIILVILILSKGGCWISVTNIGAWPLSYMKTRGGGEGVGTTPYSGWIILCSLSHRKFYDEEEYILGSLLLPFFKDLAQF